MEKTDKLIRTKLHLPFTRLELVSRPRLQVKIAEGLRGPLTLITAPAGFGKTTLVASYIVNCGLPIAWLSLDKDDNQVVRFLSYLVAALQETDNTIGSGAAQLLAAVRQEPSEAVLTSLVNDLDTAGGEIVLVLDDYQFISSQVVHEEVAFLLDHCPNTFHLVIASRSDPPLPLVRLRARGKTVELRAADLRFTEPEAAQFLNDVMGLRLNAGSVAVLEERTEGWITGLQMAALSMRDRKDVIGFIKGFSGTNRYILDYLLEEVMASQPPEIQQFLLCTSILERLTAPLCAAVLEGGNLDGWIIDKLSTNFQPPNLLNCQPILEYLERANLFLVPLDDERIWYRYHHLFADLLHARLQQTLTIQEIAALHTRAAQWYVHNGLTYEAIHHASLTSNNEWVEQLIEQNYMEMFHRGEASSMRFWTGKLSKELIYRRPWLCIYEAQSHALFGQLDEADVLLAKAEEHLQLENPSAETKSMLGHLAYVKSRVTGMRGDVHRAIELSLTARENTPASNQALQSGIGVNLGVAYFLNGDFTNAEQTFIETIQSSIAANAINGTMAAYGHLARLYAIQGRLHKSFELYQEARKFALDAGGRNLGAMSLVDMGIANVLYELNDLETALAHIKNTLEFIPLWGNADDIALAYTTLAQIQQAQGNKASAMEAIEKGIDVIQTNGVFSEARDAVRTTQVKLWLAQGDLLSAERWVASQEERLISDRGFRFENELTRMTLSRVYIAQKKPDETIRLLARLEESAESGRRKGSLIEILILKALTLKVLGETAQALAVLEKSLPQAEPEGYVRIFIHEGLPMETLLAQWSAHAGDGPLRDYANYLLSQFDAEPHQITATQERISPIGDLVEPLTLREVEVLQLICAGDSNQIIADKLVISIKTVKKHTGNIYGKLGVTSRAQAMVKARLSGLLPLEK
jgi:LuxR family maltose regulon positive regulatory protein